MKDFLFFNANKGKLLNIFIEANEDIILFVIPSIKNQLTTHTKVESKATFLSHAYDARTYFMNFRLISIGNHKLTKSKQQ